jgi:DNA-binding NtrC family response regulator
LSRRRDEAFLAVNCGEIPATLIEAELFGYEKGSFTGAARQHQGYFERVGGGTLLLDEITEMPVEMQVKLLRVLETGRFLRVGGTQEIVTHARIVAATNRDPNIAVAEGKIRQDLLYRLSVFPLHVPALYRRGADIVGLARHFVAELNAEYGTQKRLSQRARSQLLAHTWPGNVRELKNVVHRAYILSADEIEVEEALKTLPTVGCDGVDGSLAIPLGTSLPEAEQRIVLATLEHVGGNKRRAAQILGVSLKTLYNRLAHYQAAANSYRVQQAVGRA